MKRKIRGFTLIEIIIVVAISAVILVAITSLYISNKKILNKTEVKSDLQRDTAAIQELFVNIGSQADSITKIIQSGGTETTVLTFDNYVSNPLGYVDGIEGLISVRGFVLSLPKGVSGVNNPKEVITNNEYFEYKFILEANSSDTELKVIESKYDISSGVPTLVGSPREKVLSKYVDDIGIKPINYKEIEGLGGGTDVISKSTGLKVCVKFQAVKGYTDVEYELSSLMNFRNKDK